MQTSIGFDQIMQAVQILPTKQLKALKAVVDERINHVQPQSDLEVLLLNGPVATKKQLDTIAANRNALNQWRTT